MKLPVLNLYVDRIICIYDVNNIYHFPTTFCISMHRSILHLQLIVDYIHDKKKRYICPCLLVPSPTAIKQRIQSKTMKPLRLTTHLCRTIKSIRKAEPKNEILKKTKIEIEISFCSVVSRRSGYNPQNTFEALPLKAVQDLLP